MKECYQIAVKEIISFMDKCKCDECLEAKRLLLERNPELTIKMKVKKGADD